MPNDESVIVGGKGMGRVYHDCTSRGHSLELSLSTLQVQVAVNDSWLLSTDRPSLPQDTPIEQDKADADLDIKETCMLYVGLPCYSMPLATTKP